jgi:hypothetical protein
MSDERHSNEAHEWCEPIRRRPEMYVGGTGPLALQYLARALLEFPRDPTRVVLALLGNELRLEASSIPLSERPRMEGLPPYMIEVCMSLITRLDEPPTVAGVEVLDTDVEPAVFRSVPQAPTSLAIANALSEEMTIESRRGGIATSALFSRGRLLGAVPTLHGKSQMKSIG